MREAISFFFPKRAVCWVCTRVLAGYLVNAAPWMRICSYCANHFRAIKAPLCFSCGSMLRGNKQCGGCLAREQSFYFQNRSCVCYSNLVKRVVQLYKYKGKEDLFIPLASWMLSVLLSEFGQFSWDFLTWVPMDSYRLQERGFNQARMLALYLGQAIKKPAKGFLVRKKPSLPQSLLKRKKRLLISKGVFALSEYANPDVLQGKKIIIVDDVYTTGATLISCASLLLESGSKQVCSITFAR